MFFITFTLKDLFINWGDEERDLKKVYNLEEKKVDDCRQVINFIEPIVKCLQVNHLGL